MKVLENNNTFKIFNDIIIKDKLEKNVYEVCYDSFGNIYLNKTQDIILPEKIYGAETDFINLVLSKYRNSKENITVALVGDKGLGKSLTANILAKEMDLPVIKITNIPHGPQLIAFLESIKQEVVVLADEFGKTFHHERHQDYPITQSNFLSYLDGGSLSEFRKIFIFTSNFEDRLSSYLFNRPSRINYYREFSKVSINLIKEICTDLLINKELEENLLTHLPLGGLNIDTLIAIIKEINFHNRKYSEIKDFLNFRSLSNLNITASVRIDDKEYRIKSFLRVSLGKSHTTFEGEDLGYIKEYGDEPTVYALGTTTISAYIPIQEIPVEYFDESNNRVETKMKVQIETKFLNAVM